MPATILRTWSARARRDRIAAPFRKQEALVACCYLAGYVALDWASFIQPIGSFSITPWSPAIGLSFALVLLLGRGYLPLLVLAPILADWLVRGFPAPWPFKLMPGLLVGIGYGAGVSWLVWPAVDFDIAFKRARDVALLLAVGAVSVAVVAIAYVGLLCLVGEIAWSDLWRAIARFWIGDMIGIAVVTPLVLVFFRGGFTAELNRELLALVLLIVLCLGLIGHLTARTDHDHHVFDLLFLPVIWVALRGGIDGAVLALAGVQLGLLALIGGSGSMAADLTTFQAMLLVLVLTGLVIGAEVSERRRAEAQLRLQQDRQARISRIGSMGELSTALAHEINQPLAAANTYAKLTIEILESDGVETAAALEAATKCSLQVQRAANVTRRLRDFIQLGQSQILPVNIALIVEETLELLSPSLTLSDVEVRRDRASERAMPLVMADRLQIGQVLINILSNSIEAFQSNPGRQRVIAIQLRQAPPDHIEVSIEDSGPGFDRERLPMPLEPYSTTKPTGLGVGLSLCHSIIQSHGGELGLDNIAGGARVRFTLRQARSAKP